MAAQAPLVAFDPAGVGQIISYDIPEPSTYSGRSFIELEYDKSYFQPHLLKPADNPEPAAASVRRSLDTIANAPARPAVTPTGSVSHSATRPGTDGVSHSATRPPAVASVSMFGMNITTVTPTVRTSLAPAPLDTGALTRMASDGQRVTLRRTMAGRIEVVPRPKLPPPRPVFLIVESLALSTFASAYGAGRIVKTMSLMPGEKTTISVKTFARTEATRREASSILDSFTEESATEFETTLTTEQSSKESMEKSCDYYVDADAHATWAWGSANVSAGASKSTNSAREETAKAVASSTSKSSAKASSRRDVQIDTSYEVKESSGEETAIVREIQNVNVARTLNFTFRQMNQEFVSILHLVDIRVAVFNGHPGSRDEAPLSQLDELIARNVVEDAPKRAKIKADILAALQTIQDWRSQPAGDFVVERKYAEPGRPAPSTCWAVNRDRVSKHVDPVTGRSISVPGVILSVQRNVMRTEGVVVEALLGQSPALDEYALGLQIEEIAARKRQNELAQLSVERERLALDLVKSGDSAKAAIFEKV